MPFILSWPGTVDPGETDAMVCQMDFQASFAAMLGQELKPGEAPDSVNVMDALLGKSSHGRDELVLQGNGKNTIVRHKNWTCIPPREGPEKHYSGIELGNSLEPQLYNISWDIGQVRNVAEEESDIVAEIEDRLQNILASEKTRT